MQPQQNELVLLLIRRRPHLLTYLACMIVGGDASPLADIVSAAFLVAGWRAYASHIQASSLVFPPPRRQVTQGKRRISMSSTHAWSKLPSKAASVMIGSQYKPPSPDISTPAPARIVGTITNVMGRPVPYSH